MICNHARNTAAMLASACCGARTGTPCKAPAVAGNRRCRMHGGKGSGAPKGNRNAYKDGFYASETRAQVKRMRDLVQDMEEFLEGRTDNKA